MENVEARYKRIFTAWMELVNYSDPGPTVPGFGRYVSPGVILSSSGALRIPVHTAGSGDSLADLTIDEEDRMTLAFAPDDKFEIESGTEAAQVLSVRFKEQA